MKKILLFFIHYIIRISLKIRYRITIKGKENLSKEALSRSKGILFLPNHPCQMDPVIVASLLWGRFSPRAMMAEYVYYTPGIHWIAKKIRAVPIPNFDLSMNSYKRKVNDKAFDEAIDTIENNGNFLIYPGARLKHTNKEVVGGASGVHRILQDVPEANIVLVRTTGLWGSRFSRAISGTVPSFGSTFFGAIKDAFKNLIFFMPKRRVTVEFVSNPPDFPYNGTRSEINQYLETFYNTGHEGQEEEGEPLVLVSNYFWKQEYPEITANKSQYEDVVDVSSVSQKIKDTVLSELSQMSHKPVAEIKENMHLSMDLGLDSLDGADLVVFLENHFEVSGVLPGHLTTVSRVISIAAKQTEIEETVDEDVKSGEAWFKNQDRPDAIIPAGKTIGEVFLKQCDRMGNVMACVDDKGNTMTYRQLKMRAILLARYIRQLPGDTVGILLPSTIASTLCIFACQLARKVPVMVNWTVGPRHLKTVVEVSEIQSVLTSWKFLDRLDGVDLDGIDDKLLMLEDIVRDLTLLDKVKTGLLSTRKASALMKHFGLNEVSENSPSVMLFTSGTEGAPKGVPLSHRNILFNQRSTIEKIILEKSDVLYGMLPPFHSFGFNVTGILPILAGVKAVYYPNPTDSVALAKGVEKWKVTLLCSAPTFLNAILRSGEKSLFDSVRYFMVGAEKAPPELRTLVNSMGGDRELLDGYGITECAPVLTITIPGEKAKGVGKPIPGIEMKIIHAETHAPIEQGEQGLIIAHGPNVFPGYANAGIRNPFIDLDGKRWYNTGDLGFFDEEGCLHLSGRLKRFIKVGGEMVSLLAIESALLEAIPQMEWKIRKDQEGPLLAVCAEEVAGEKPNVYLFTTFPCSVEEANQALRSQGFSNIVRISSVKELEEIPVMGTGKIFYRRLEQWYVHASE